MVFITGVLAPIIGFLAGAFVCGSAKAGEILELRIENYELKKKLEEGNNGVSKRKKKSSAV